MRNTENFTGKILKVIDNKIGLAVDEVYCDYHHVEEKSVFITNIWGCPLSEPSPQWCPDHYFKLGG